MVATSERKHKHESESEIEVCSEDLGFVYEPTRIEVGSGYTLSVRYDENKKPIVDVKTYGDVNIPKLRKEIERIYPNAQILHLGQKSSVIIAKKSRKKRNRKKK